MHSCVFTQPWISHQPPARPLSPSSTQSLKAEVIDSKLSVVASASIKFNDMKEYKTVRGTLVKGLQVTAPSIMFAEALDFVMGRIAKEIPASQLQRIVGISVSGQQHGSVWWARGAERTLKNLDPERSLKEQLTNSFSKRNGPIWMDSSTSEECNYLRQALGGDKRVIELSGSRPFERFTGNQIRKVIQKEPQVYSKTERISLVSSAITSMLVGRYAPIDWSDGSGMNLMNIRAKCWSWELLQSVASPDVPGAAIDSGDLGARAALLMKKLGGNDGLASPQAVVGCISDYFIKKYGFSKRCRVVVGSGDNPCSLVGLRAAQGDVVVSLGTSDTVFALAEEPGMDSRNGHVLTNPVDPSTYVKMLCFKNGSLTREAVRAKYSDGTWDGFNAALRGTPKGNNGWVGIYFVAPEIVPDFNASKVFRFSPQNKPMTNCQTPQNEIRALVEGHFLSMRLHCSRMGLPPTNRVIATGGASANKQLTQVLADVFKAPVYVHRDGGGSAALGAALRALQGIACAALNSFISLEDALKACGCPPGTDFFIEAAKPAAPNVYDSLLKRYAELERAVVLVGAYNTL